jgi:predicted DNA-binding protein YlxM (UPF0122 family)
MVTKIIKNGQDGLASYEKVLMLLKNSVPKPTVFQNLAKLSTELETKILLN